MVDTVAKALVKCLYNLGVRRIYGLIGTSIIDFIDALSLYREKIRFITTRHEQVAVSMADAEGRIIGKPGVATVHAGPGFLNSLISVANAYKDSSPMILIAGAVRRRLTGLDYWLEVDQMKIVQSITKAQYRIDTANDLVNIIRNAYKDAVSPPSGPVFVEVPEDVWNRTGNFDYSKCKINGVVIQEPETGYVDKIIRYIENSEKPLILAGGGVNNRESGEKLLQLSELLDIPIVTTGSGRGVAPEDHPLVLGRVGFGGGSIYADKALEESDLVITLGCGLSDITTYSYTIMPKGEIIMVNLDEKSGEKPVPYSEWFYADANLLLEKLLRKVKETGLKKKHESWLESIKKWKRGWNAILQECLTRNYEGAVNPNKFFKTLDDKLDMENTIITAGQGIHILYTYAYLKIKKPRSFLASTNLGAMGFAFPAALAAKIVYPEKETIAIVGDGEFMMTLQDLETAVRENIAVKIIVVNDNSYRVLYYRQKLQKMGRIYGTVLRNPNFAELAKTFGVNGLTLSNDSMIDASIDKMLNSDEPFVIDLKIDRDDMPPLNLEASLKMSSL